MGDLDGVAGPGEEPYSGTPPRPVKVSCSVRPGGLEEPTSPMPARLAEPNWGMPARLAEPNSGIPASLI
jgi:hypothetical protein